MCKTAKIDFPAEPGLHRINVCPKAIARDLDPIDQPARQVTHERPGVFSAVAALAKMSEGLTYTIETEGTFGAFQWAHGNALTKKHLLELAGTAVEESTLADFLHAVPPISACSSGIL